MVEDVNLPAAQLQVSQQVTIFIIS
jgi:hypothetical protein